MSAAGLDFSIILPALLAGMLVLVTHVPLGRAVLARGIVFIDLAIAQVAGLGVVAAGALGFEPQGWAMQMAALTAAVLGALLLTWSEKHWPEIQEALIGVVFVLAASASLLLLAKNPHGGEHLKDLLVGQILWVNNTQLLGAVIVTAALSVFWLVRRERLGRTGFYLLFACAITMSVQLIGIYLVFASLIIPALAARNLPRMRGLTLAYLVGAAGYLSGLGASAMFDLPSGAVIVWTVAFAALAGRAIMRSDKA